MAEVLLSIVPQSEDNVREIEVHGTDIYDLPIQVRQSHLENTARDLESGELAGFVADPILMQDIQGRRRFMRCMNEFDNMRHLPAAGLFANLGKSYQVCRSEWDIEFIEFALRVLKEDPQMSLKRYNRILNKEDLRRKQAVERTHQKIERLAQSHAERRRNKRDAEARQRRSKLRITK